MSVILFTPEEIARTYRQYEAIAPALSAYAPTKERVALALTAFHYANVMAYCLTYADWSHDRAGTFHDIEAAINAAPRCWTTGPRTMRQVARQLRSFLYNSISNAGTCCLPDPYRQTLDGTASAIADFLAGIYRDEDEPAA
jgi:hypothetical protein